jgi:hypothetical protein
LITRVDQSVFLSRFLPMSARRRLANAR